ncbi:hypothetical protein OIE62_19625 [Streptomyces scopuliridis]|uniref:Uncharacterized protein n=1 Tax=Streptomyces scopuliridis TaxID=452529 RepID=A0ACD4ZMQ7_9ACTN|nr:hypothetical protein [Streptomyces scopuliridis]WSB35038.1 hypothetical protein OG949_20745 [Streptomyces scopuliridis]WSB99296.1 hypothetical protein OG835_21325 [Streptomyces scopuliridis]WSC07003.1 hypothetical protein OIE62_19625 [Streptomyces scopuliridis]
MCEQDTSDPPTAASSPASSKATSNSPRVSSRSLPPPHEATTVERGSFCTARCTCGWSGHARRSRDLARTDAANHAANRTAES